MHWLPRRLSIRHCCLRACNPRHLLYHAFVLSLPLRAEGHVYLAPLARPCSACFRWCMGGPQSSEPPIMVLSREESVMRCGVCAASLELVTCAAVSVEGQDGPPLFGGPVAGFKARWSLVFRDQGLQLQADRFARDPKAWLVEEPKACQLVGQYGIPRSRCGHRSKNAPNGTVPNSSSWM
jgi:hypothetical protein